ncbi:DUF1924 domain-containing protein [Halopseudomonas salegens]|nr:DUF1924 domain-containing protein [Halopseudomonas salegens]
MGKQLYNDTTLSSNNLSCASCHGDESKPSMFQHTFTQAYPHPVAMATNQFGMDQVYLDEMIQICMVAPMASNPLPWESMELAALTAYVGSLQASYAPNPCAANPCVANNPCAANPCAANPCAASNPCTANPCAAKNPCSARNPCAAKRAPCAAI